MGREQAADKVVEICELREQLATVIEDVQGGGATYVVAQGGQLVAAIVPYGTIEKWRRVEREIVEGFNRVMARMAEQNAHFTEEEVDADVREAVREVREARS